MNDRLLYEIARRPFDGTIRRGRKRGKGSRRDFILTALSRAGLEPRIDPYGNVWAESGRSGVVRVLSSHMDVDPRCKKQPLGIRSVRHARHGDCYRGILDNAVGCYLNLQIASTNKNGPRTIHVFTASEEAPLDNSRICMSAHDVVRHLKRNNIKPSVCVALDVTYPKLRVSPESLHKLWDDHHYPQLFDHTDRVQGYVDGITGRSKGRATTMAKRFIRDYKQAGPRGAVSVRELAGWDEAEVYSRIAPSFAFGPVVFGKFDEPGQMMPKKHVQTAMKFLRTLTAKQ